MRISYRWLLELLPSLEATPDELASHLTRLGLLVEEVLRPSAGLESVVVGRVVETTPHPAAERLTLCVVDAGGGERRRIVCGAPVVKEGAFYPLALPGARLPNGVTIGVSEIRGERSEGMLCSAPELALDHLGEASGILELETTDARPGEPVARLLGLDDAIFVVDVPANRADWESHLGVAREVRSLAGDDVRLPNAAGGAAHEGRHATKPRRDGRSSGPAGRDVATSETTRLEDRGNGAVVRIEDPVGCPRYMARVIHGVRLGLAPLAARQRLFLLGVRPINNVVDATNYTMLEIGTPLHAFDLRRIPDGEVRIRRGRRAETLVTLDGKERAVGESVTVIADRERAIAVAGVMGGRDTEVTDATTAVLLEGAFFDPERVRATAAALGLRTEASHRFSRGVDPHAVPLGVARSSALIGEWAGGVLGATLDAGSPPPPAAPLSLRPERVASITGLEVGRDEARAALEAIDFNVSDAGSELSVTVPSHRYDVRREVDLVEEVARRLGYDRVPLQAYGQRVGVTPPSRAAAVAELARELRGLGLDEAISPSFFDPTPFEPGFFPGRLLEPSNPLALHERFLRPTLAPGLLLTARHNLRRGAGGVSLFEIGHVFERETTESSDRGNGGGAAASPQELPRLPGVRERRVLGITMAGSPFPRHWDGEVAERPADFYDVKGVIETLVGASGLETRPSTMTWLHPGQQAELHAWGRRLGFAGRLHPRVERALELDTTAFFAELELEPLLGARPTHRYVPLSAYPRVERDLALVVPEERHAAGVRALLESTALENLVELALFDVYRGEQVPPGTKSLAFRLVFQSDRRTLTEHDVEGEISRLLEVLAQSGIRLR